MRRFALRLAVALFTFALGVFVSVLRNERESFWNLFYRSSMLAVRGLVVTPNAVTPSGQTEPLSIIFEVFFAGLALKGMAEAADGQAMSTVPRASTASQPNSIALSASAVAGALPPSSLK